MASICLYFDDKVVSESQPSVVFGSSISRVTVTVCTLAALVVVNENTCLAGNFFAPTGLKSE